MTTPYDSFLVFPTTKLKVLLLVALFSVVGVLVVAMLQLQEPEDDWPVQVPLISLLVAPESHEEEIVSVFGYLALGITLRLYLSKDHADGADMASAMVVNVSNFSDSDEATISAECIENHVEVIGRFLRDGSAWIISEVQSIGLAHENRDCWEKGVQEIVD